MMVGPWLVKLQPSLCEVPDFAADKPGSGKDGSAERRHGLQCRQCGGGEWQLNTVREPVQQRTNFAAVAECAKCGRTFGVFNANDFGSDFPLHAGRILKCSCAGSTFRPVLALHPDPAAPDDPDRAARFQLLARCTACNSDLTVIDWEFEG